MAAAGTGATPRIDIYLMHRKDLKDRATLLLIEMIRERLNNELTDQPSRAGS